MKRTRPSGPSLVGDENRLVGEALDDRESLRAHTGKDCPKAARDTALRRLAAVEGLPETHPHIERLGRVAGTRALVIAQTPYIVPNRIDTSVVFVLRIYP